MNRTSAWGFLLLWCLGGAAAAEEEVNWDDLDAGESAVPEARPSEPAGVPFSLYADIKLQADYGEKTDKTASQYLYSPALNFGQNHFSLLGSLHKGPYQASFDFSLATFSSEFFEFTLFTGFGSVTAGKIYLPFGAPNYHHLYGGFAGSSAFIPYSFSSFGIKSQWDLAPWISLEVSVSNGFGKSTGKDSVTRPNLSSLASLDTDVLKMVNFRVNLKPTLSTAGSFSLLFDPLKDEAPLENSVLMYGTDWSQRLGSFLLRGGLALAEVRVKEDGLGSRLWFPLTYYRLAWYGEASHQFTGFTARLRVGAVDPDSRKGDIEDKMNANIGVVVPTDFGEFQGVYSYTWTLSSADVLTPDTVTGRKNHQLMIKLLIQI